MRLVWDLLTKYQTELLIQVCVLIACWLVSLVFDLFSPPALPDVLVRRLVLLFCAPIGFVISMVLWYSITDPDNDKLATRIIISALGATAGGLGAPYFNRWVAALIKWKWPTLGLNTSFTK